MTVKWFFARDDKTFGPFSADQMKEQAAGGRVRPQDLVWKEGMEQGVPASKVKHLFSAPGAPAEDAAAAAPAPPAPREAPPVRESEEASREAGSAPDETGAAPPEEGPAPARHEIPARPEQKVPPAGSQPPPQPPARKYRVFNIKGGVIMSQDGERFRYRKTCPKCGHQDRSITSGPIQPGTTRSHFFCPKCRKNHPVEVHASS